MAEKERRDIPEGERGTWVSEVKQREEKKRAHMIGTMRRGVKLDR